MLRCSQARSRLLTQAFYRKDCVGQRKSIGLLIQCACRLYHLALACSVYTAELGGLVTIEGLLWSFAFSCFLQRNCMTLSVPQFLPISVTPSLLALFVPFGSSGKTISYSFMFV